MTTLSETELTAMQTRHRQFNVTDARLRAKRAVPATKSPNGPAQSRRMLIDVNAALATSKAKTKAGDPSVAASAPVKAAKPGPYALIIREGLNMIARIVSISGEAALVKYVLGNGQEAVGTPLQLFSLKAKNLVVLETLDDVRAYAEIEGISILGTATGDDLTAELKGALAEYALRKIGTK